MHARNLFYVVMLLMIAAPLTSTRAAEEQFRWIIKHEKWLPEHEAAYSDLVERIGDAVQNRVCRTLDECMQLRRVNPHFKEFEAEINFNGDCSKMAHTVRAYVAWKFNLPFLHTLDVEARVPTEKGLDLRYTPGGNRVNKSKSITVPSENDVVDVRDVIRGITRTVSTAVFRITYLRGSPGEKLPEFYSPNITNSDIRPGTIIYDPDGHVVVVYRVDKAQGRIWYVDNHPDQHLTFGSYDRRFDRGSPFQGAGFKNWRPIELRGANRQGDGSLAGGSIHVFGGPIGENIDNFTQYLGNDGTLSDLTKWRNAKFFVSANGAKREVSFYEYVRYQMGGNAKLDPLKELGQVLDTICIDLAARVSAVQLAARLQVGALTATRDKPHPQRLPDNIYASQDSEWENFATPSRDARLKISFINLRADTKNWVDRWIAHDSLIDYSGKDLKKDLLTVLRQKEQSCTVKYINSENAGIALSLAEIRKRLFELSFDPYLCTELRWGATGAELAKCPQESNVDRVKLEWHRWERRLRNQNERIYSGKMNFSLDDLRRGREANFGRDKPLDTCVETVLGATC